MLRSDLCNYCEDYIFVKETTDLGVTGNNNATEKGVVLENNALLRSRISKISSAFINNAEDLDILMIIYNLLEYSDIYSMTPGSLWNH